MSQDGDELALAIEYSHVLADDDDADDKRGPSNLLNGARTLR